MTKGSLASETSSSEEAAIKCNECHVVHPAGSFLPAPRRPGGRLERCTDCIKAEARRFREARERRQAASLERAS